MPLFFDDDVPQPEIDHMVDVWVPKLVNSIEAQRLGAAENLASEVKDAKSELDFILNTARWGGGPLHRAIRLVDPVSSELRTVCG